MYPTLSDITKDLFGFGIPIRLATFGFLVALSFLFSAYFLKLELKRKEKDGLIHPFFDKKGNSVHPYQIVSNIMLIAAIAGVIGARIFSIFEYPDEFIHAPIATLISFSGLTFYGGLIFGSVAVIIYTRKRGIRTIHLLDAAAPSLLLAYGIGRMGCHLSGDGDWGIDNLSPKPSWMNFLLDWMWAFSYPNNVIGAGVPFSGEGDKISTVLANPVFPTPFYEFVFGILFFAIFWAMRKKIHTAGLLFSLYLMATGIERFLIEKIRIDSEYHIFNIEFKQASLISILIFLAGLILTGISLRQNMIQKTN